MSGVRKTALPSGKYQGWFIDYTGKRKFFVGTRDKADTLRMAVRLEDDHRQIRLGYRPAPQPFEKHKNRSFEEVCKEYQAWGESQGGRGGRPWARNHARMRRNHLNWWRERLGLSTLADLDNVLPRVEGALREIKATGRTGKTIWNIAEALTAFCDWCVTRGYLANDPLRRLSKFDTTPGTKRRALMPREIVKLLEAAPEHRRLLYETALMTGLRAGELRSLTPGHLDVQRSGLHLEARWTKNRKSAFQPLPHDLVCRLREFADTGNALELYRRAARWRNAQIPKNPLLFVVQDTAHELDKDLTAAGIPKMTEEGKLDFHALRTTFVSMLFESGASAKETQALARHSTADLTMNVYARTRDERLTQVVERLAEMVLSPEPCACSVHEQAVGAEDCSVNLIDISTLHEGMDGQGRRFKSRPGQDFPICATECHSMTDTA